MFSTRSRGRHVVHAALILALVTVYGCEKKSEVTPPAAGGSTTTTPTGEAGAPAAAPTAAGKTKLDPSTVAEGGTISGLVKLAGNPPALPPVNMQAKPECAALHPQAVPAENLVTGEGGALQNVFVYISGGLESYSFDPPADPAGIDQKGCVYVPHVFGIMVGQDLEIQNSDPFLHNVKVNDNRPLNEAMPKPSTTVKSKWFKKVGVPTTFQCEVHPWMRAYACVVDHPYFAVTGTDGNFSIGKLPPGKYKVTVWHEAFPGLKAPAEQEVEVKAGETASVNFEYSI